MQIINNNIKEEVKLKIYLKLLIIPLIIVLFGGCGSPVYADSSEYKYGEDKFSFEDLTPRFLNGEDDSGGIEYYYEKLSFYSILSSEIDIPSQEPFDSYPYWFFYGNRVYASEHPFEFLNGKIVTPLDDFELNYEFYSYTYGMFKTGSVYSFYPGTSASNLKLIYSNHEIKKHKENSNDKDYDRFSEYYTVVSDNIKPDLSGDYRFLRLNFYNFRTPANFDFGFWKSDSGIYHLGYYSGDDFGTVSGTCRYSYFDSEYLACESQAYFLKASIGYISDETILRHYVSSNYDVRYPGGFLSISSPNLMPPGWQPTYSNDKIPRPGDIINPVDPGDEDDGIFSSILKFLGDIVSYINPLHENFILKGVLSFLGDIITYINPLHENFFLNGIFDFFGDLISYINPFSENFFLKVAFVPSDDFFPNEIEKLIRRNESLFNTFGHVTDSLKRIFETDFGTAKFEGVEYGDKKLILGSSAVVCNADNYEDFGFSSPAFCAGAPGGTGDLNIAWKYRYEFDLSNFKLIDASYIASFISKFRYWVGAVLQFFFMIWLVKWLLSFFGYHSPAGGYHDTSGGNKIGFL